MRRGRRSSWKVGHGRIEGAHRLVGTALSIKPLRLLDDGRIEPLASVSKKKSIERLLQIAEETLKGRGKIHTAVLYTSAEDVAGMIFNEAAARLEPVKLLKDELSPVVGAHTGLGTVCLAYHAER